MIDNLYKYMLTFCVKTIYGNYCYNLKKSVSGTVAGGTRRMTDKMSVIHDKKRFGTEYAIIEV